ncbi:TPA: hypothetical protein DIC40_08540 [Patescibacteria group bacterium]|nr:hypothetical protein [Candidatus Gracilibacteria bacterium]
MLKDIWPGTMGSFPDKFLLGSGQLFFVATDGEYGRELRSTDGTEEGTQMIIDIVINGNTSSPGNFTIMNNKVYFAATDGIK